jgi:hypothetical protein
MSTEIITLRLTDDNVESALKIGDAFTDDPEFGVILSVRVITAGAKIFTDRDSDTLGLPQTVRVSRHV